LGPADLFSSGWQWHAIPIQETRNDDDVEEWYRSNIQMLGKGMDRG
jgi:hypothetical protein